MPLQPAQARPRRSADQTATLRPQDTGHWHVVVAVCVFPQRFGCASPLKPTGLNAPPHTGRCAGTEDAQGPLMDGLPGRKKKWSLGMERWFVSVMVCLGHRAAATERRRRGISLSSTQPTGARAISVSAGAARPRSRKSGPLSLPCRLPRLPCCPVRA